MVGPSSMHHYTNSCIIPAEHQSDGSHAGSHPARGRLYSSHCIRSLCFPEGPWATAGAADTGVQRDCGIP